MHILMTEAQAKTVGAVGEVNGNIIVEQDGENITLTYATADGNLLFERVYADGTKADAHLPTAA